MTALDDADQDFTPEETATWDEARFLEYWGLRCAAFEPSCPGCQAWALRDKAQPFYAHE